MSDALILVNEETPGIIILTLNRPTKRNALNIELLKEFCRQMEIIKIKHSAKAIIIKGAGPVFCSGLDLQELADIKFEEESAKYITRSLTMLFQFPIVTIAAVHGAAIGGGGGIMSACDFVVAASDLRCGFPEVRRGLVPAQIAAILHRQLSWRNLRELFLLGEIIDAEKAKSLGLINVVVPPSNLMTEALRIAGLALKGAPEAMRETKKLLDSLFPSDFEQDLVKTTPYHHKARHSKEAIEGAKAFLEKREPVW